MEKLFIFLKTSTDAISDVFVVLSFKAFLFSSCRTAKKSVRYGLEWKRVDEDEDDAEGG